MNATSKPAPVSASNTARPRYLRPVDARLAIKRRAALISRQARELEGLTQRDLAPELGADQSNLARFEIGTETVAINIVHLVAGARSPLARAYVLRIKRWLDSEINPAADVHGENELARLASLTAESGDVLRCLTASLVDGEQTTDELVLLEREAGELEQAAAEARARYAAELRRRREAG